MDKKKIIGIVVGGIALILALFFGININSGSGDPASQLSEFIGTGPDGQPFTTNNLLGMVDANRNYTVYITKYGKKYHTADCRYVLGKSISISRLEALEEGYEPCKRCKPDGAYTGTQPIPPTTPRRDTEPEKTTDAEKDEPSYDDMELDPYLE